MHKRGPAGAGNPPCQREGAELTLGMDNIRPPGDQRMQSGVGIRRAQPRARVDQSRIDRADSPDAVGRPTVQAAGQRQYADLMPLALQGAAQRQHAGDHAVDGGDVPIGCQQDLHRRSLISCHLANCAAPNLAARLQPLYLLERGSRAFFGRFTKFSPRFYSTTQKFRKGS